MRRIIFSLFLIILTSNLYAQGGLSNAVIHWQEGLLDKAKPAIDEAVKNEKNVGKSKAWYYKGRIYASIAGDATGLYSKLEPNAAIIAYESYQKALQLEPEKKGYYADTQEALKELHTIVVNKGVTFYQDKDLENALKHFELAQQTNATDTIPYLYAADVAYNLNKTDNYIASIEKMLTFYKKAEYYTNLAITYKEVKKDNNKALAVVKEGLKTFPTDKTLQSVQLNLLLETGKMDEGIEALKKEVEMDPKNAQKHLNLGILYEKKGQADLAIASYQKGLAIEPNNRDLNFNLGAVYYNKGAEMMKKVNAMDLPTFNKEGKKEEAKARAEFEKALPYFEKNYKQNPKDVDAMGPLQSIYSIVGRKADADRLDKELQMLEKGTDTGELHNGKKVYVGSQGGKYYINDNGTKTYLNR